MMERMGIDGQGEQLTESCEFTDGDMTEGDEHPVDDADTEEACAKNVRLSMYSKKATGATWEPNTKQCWAETGYSIDASATRYRTCHLPREGKVCDFSIGDGLGTREEYLAKADTPEHCVKMVTDQRPAANGVTYGGGHGKNCYAEMGMKGIDDKEKAWNSCQLEDCLVDGNAGDGTVKGTCSSGLLCHADGQCRTIYGTCNDGIRNQGEDGVDCGGPCEKNCADCKSDGGENPTCVFPFKYDYDLYRKCTDVGKDFYWCATKVDGDGNYISGEWAVCNDECPKGSDCMESSDCPNGFDCSGGICKATCDRKGTRCGFYDCGNCNCCSGKCEPTIYTIVGESSYECDGELAGNWFTDM